MFRFGEKIYVIALKNKRARTTFNQNHSDFHNFFDENYSKLDNNFSPTLARTSAGDHGNFAFIDIADDSTKPKHDGIIC